MSTEKAQALVVRGTDWSETSRITTLFTREFGKVRALAKGGRRVKSNFEIAFDLLTVCRIVFIRKGQGGLDLLTEARMEERFPALRHDIQALYAGYYIAELLADGTQDYDPHPELFDVALQTLRRLGEPGTIPDRVIAFELAWLRELGYSPRLDACTSCGSERRLDGDVMDFSPSAGGVLCRECGGSVADRRPITQTGIRALRDRWTGNESPLPSQILRELRSVVGHLVSSVLGRRPRLLGYIEGRPGSG